MSTFDLPTFDLPTFNMRLVGPLYADPDFRKYLSLVVMVDNKVDWEKSVDNFANMKTGVSEERRKGLKDLLDNFAYVPKHSGAFLYENVTRLLKLVALSIILEGRNARKFMGNQPMRADIVSSWMPFTLNLAWQTLQEFLVSDDYKKYQELQNKFLSANPDACSAYMSACNTTRST